MNCPHPPHPPKPASVLKAEVNWWREYLHNKHSEPGLTPDEFTAKKEAERKAKEEAKEKEAKRKTLAEAAVEELVEAIKKAAPGVHIEYPGPVPATPQEATQQEDQEAQEEEEDTDELPLVPVRITFRGYLAHHQENPEAIVGWLRSGEAVQADVMVEVAPNVGVRDLANVVEVTVESVEITDVGFLQE